MMDNERFLKNRLSKDSPFRIPEGYFDDFASQLMDKLPEQAPVSLHLTHVRKLRWKAWACAAACVLAGIFGGVLFFSQMDKRNLNNAESGTVAHSSAFFDEVYDETAADYAMIDNADIYVYLTDNSGE